MLGMYLHGNINFNDKRNKTMETVIFGEGHYMSITSVCVTIDGNTIISGSQDNTIRLWDLKTRKQIQALECFDSVSSLCVKSDGNIFISDGNRGITLWDLESRKQIKTLQNPN